MSMLKSITETKPFFMYVKKHYCPNCGVKLTKSKMINVSDRRTVLSKRYNDGFTHGVYETKKVDHIFECEQCKRVYHLNDLKKQQQKQQFQN